MDNLFCYTGGVQEVAGLFICQQRVRYFVSRPRFLNKSMAKHKVTDFLVKANYVQ